MKFFDEVQITVQSGKGWDGVATGRREKNIPFGWPSGGDGWRWGSVFFVWSENEWTLMPYRYNVMFRANEWEQGWSRDRYGKDSEDIYLKVPLGTSIKNSETGTVLAHITQHDEQVMICRWGRWWLGNMHFTTPSNQYPEVHLLGEPGQKKKLTLELQMLWDVALIGTPSVGKSTIINTISNVKAKTAEYYFTTLVPNIWVVEHKGKSFVMIDIPGLIAGASDGKWLGNDFLRHILKSRVLCFVLDAGRMESGWEDFGVLLGELMQYVRTRDSDTDGTSEIGLEIHQHKLYLVYTKNDEVYRRKNIQWIVNKSDMLGDEEIIGEYLDGRLTSARDQLAPYLDVWSELVQASTFVISAATRQGLDPMLDSLRSSVENPHIISIQELWDGVDMDTHTNTMVDTTEHMLPILIESQYLPEDGDFSALHIRTIDHEEMSTLAYMIPRGNQETEFWFWSELANKNILIRLEQWWAKMGDILHIRSPYDGIKDRYILRE